MKAEIFSFDFLACTNIFSIGYKLDIAFSNCTSANISSTYQVIQ
jgi:hypothetical protein